jgi:C1A family cysteine protease
LCGWDYSGFYVLNQWGKVWGSKGYAIIPYDTFLKQFMYGTYIHIGD